jgi:hypothetical protein
MRFLSRRLKFPLDVFIAASLVCAFTSCARTAEGPVAPTIPVVVPTADPVVEIAVELEDRVIDELRS